MAAPLFSSIQPSDLFSKFKPESRFWKILNFPLQRVIVIALFLVPIMAINGVVVFSIKAFELNLKGAWNENVLVEDTAPAFHQQTCGSHGRPAPCCIDVIID